MLKELRGLGWEIPGRLVLLRNRFRHLVYYEIGIRPPRTSETSATLTTCGTMGIWSQSSTVHEHSQLMPVAAWEDSASLYRTVHILPRFGGRNITETRLR